MNRRLTFAPLTEILGIPIVDINGALVGNLTELLIDESDGRIAYVRFRLNGVNESVDREMTVPWSAMSATDRIASGWQLCVGKSTLENLSRPAPH